MLKNDVSPVSRKRQPRGLALGLTLWTLWMLGAPRTASAATAASAGQIQALLAKPPVLCGDFEQSKQLIGIKKPLVSHGRFCVVTDKGVLWRTLKPFANTVRLTRDEIIHTQDGRVVQRLDASHEPTVRMINRVLFALLSGDLGQLERLFAMHGTVDGTQWHVTLTARDAALAKAIGLITLEGGAYVKRIAIDESGGDRTRIGVTHVVTGASALMPEEAAAFE